MADEHPIGDLLLDLAVSDVDVGHRADLTRHLDSCATCRAEYAALAGAVDRVLAAAPGVSPPPGFARSVLEALEALEADRSGGRRRHGDDAAHPRAQDHDRRRARPRPSRAPDRPRAARRGAAIAAAVVLGMVVGAGAGVAVLATREQEPATRVAAAGADLITDDDRRVGTVLESWYSGQAVLVVTLAGGRPGVRYDCELVLADGTRRPAGSWILDDSAEATWVVPRPDDAAVVGVELVTGSGRTWATASL